jgi:hypothetical protein
LDVSSICPLFEWITVSEYSLKSQKRPVVQLSLDAGHFAIYLESNYRMNLLLLLLLLRLRLPQRDHKSASIAQVSTPAIKRTPANMTYALRSSMPPSSSGGFAVSLGSLPLASTSHPRLVFSGGYQPRIC